MIKTVVVGHGLAGRSFHCPLIRRQPGLQPARDRGPRSRDPVASRGAVGPRMYAAMRDLDEALADPEVELVVIATPHDSHAELAVPHPRAGKHCVVDKVMALTTAEADRMIAARDRSGCMLSVFHNRRWDWDYLTVQGSSRPGHARAAALDRKLRLPLRASAELARSARSAGTILHDWGAHLVDQALQLGLGPCRRLTAWILPAPWARRRSAALTGGSSSSSTTCSFRSNRAGFARSTVPVGGSSAQTAGL